MIKNRHQARVARSRIRDLEASAAASEGFEREQYEALIEDVTEELDEFESIAAGLQYEFPVTSLDDVVQAAIKARIARGMSQADLAELIGVSEQQIQRHEAQEYQKASWVRIADTLDALGFELEGLVRKTSAAEGAPVVWVDFSARRGARHDEETTSRNGWGLADLEWRNRG